MGNIFEIIGQPPFPLATAINHGLLGQGGLGLAQQAQLQQLQQGTFGAVADTTSTAISFGPNGWIDGCKLKAAKKKPETALDWLDRRVEEVRVKL